MTFPAKLGLLDDTNVWIADTGVAVHSMLHVAGMVDIKKASSQVTMGNGANFKETIIGNINRTICDKFGNEVCESDERCFTLTTCEVQLIQYFKDAEQWMASVWK